MYGARDGRSDDAVVVLRRLLHGNEAQGCAASAFIVLEPGHRSLRTALRRFNLPRYPVRSHDGKEQAMQTNPQAVPDPGDIRRRGGRRGE